MKAGAAPATLDAMRRRGIQVWAMVGWVALALMLVADLAMETGNALALLVVGCVANALPTAVALRGRFDPEARTAVGALAATLPAMLVFLLQGHPWQMDAHMYFFVAMAGLVVLGDWRPIVLATVLTAFHHLLLEWLRPEWVFAGSGNLLRVLFHALAVVIQAVLLCFVTTRLSRLLASQDESIRAAQAATGLAEAERRRTEQALIQARGAEAEAADERRARADATARADAERRGELMTLAGEFERSVSSVVRTIGSAAGRLETSAARMDHVVSEADGAAEEVAAGAAQAAAGITQVAISVRDLSRSIRTIAASAAEQSELTGVASGEADASVLTVARLEQQALRIEQLVEDIRKLAAKTNLLALNATIEAARAGDAGRGFAVVAGEVKGLASETTRASDQISTLLADVREGVADTAGKLRGVDGAIGRVATAAAGIAAAAAEQRSTAQEVDGGADRAAASSGDVGRRIGEVAAAAGHAAALSTEVRDSAADLARGARELRASADRFVSFLRAGEAA